MARPTLGVALPLSELATHHALVRDHNRDVELQDFVDASVLCGDWSALATRARELLDGHGGRWGIHGPFWGFSLGTNDPDIRQVVQKRLDQGLDVCEAIGGTHMVIHSPANVWGHHNEGNWPNARERDVEAFVATVGPAAARAADMGCVLVLENIEDFDPAMRNDYLAALQDRGIAASIDTGHANYVHTMHGAPPVDYHVRTAGKRLAHVHIQDSDGRADRHWSPGEGTIPWPAVFRALHEATTLDAGGPDAPRLMLELRDKAKVPAAIAHLSGLGLAH